MPGHFILPEIEGLSKARWIAVPGRCFNWRNRDFTPAPLFRKSFSYHRGAASGRALLTVAAGGYCEVYLNGRKISPAVLWPTPSNFDKRIYFRSFDVTDLLQDGDNAAGAILGNSIYNCNAQGVWMQSTAIWRDYPRLLLQINDGNGRPATFTDESWQCFDNGPIRIDSIRNGETYDARLEIPGWSATEFDASSWPHAAIGHAPGGAMAPEKHPLCVVYKTLPMRKLAGCNIYDGGQNLAGWARIKVEGSAGSVVTLRYGEHLNEDGSLFAGNTFVEVGEPQTDRYTLKGGGTEVWSPRFSYYGFRYVEVEIEGEAKLLSIDACAVGSDFAEAGSLDCSAPLINRIVDLTRWSFRSNFMGHPTDCPSREKQGWTGDALCAVETGLYLYDSASSYEDWIDSVGDTQRPSGQLAAKSPISSSGYNWGFGPAWDSAFIMIPDAIHSFTGSVRCIKAHYEGMLKYLDFCDSMCPGHIAASGFGLGDWCYPGNTGGAAPAELISTAFYCRDLEIVARFATLLGRKDDSRRCLELAQEVKGAFLKKFANSDGGFAGNDCASLALAVAFELAPNPETTMDLLAKEVERNSYRSMFGIIGSKFVPIVLAESGRLDAAIRLLLQEDFPSYGWELKQGATTLWENWNGEASQNHIMFGTVPAWCFRYLGGFRFSPEAPGRMELQPQASVLLGGFSAVYRGVKSSWRIAAGKCRYEAELPDGVKLELTLPDGTRHALSAGRSTFELGLSGKDGGK